jgi:hypothetical protein
MLSDKLGLRLSLGQELGGPNYELQTGRATIGDDAHDANGAARLEYRDGDARAVADLFVDSRHYINLPNDEQLFFLDVDRETTIRGDAKVDDKFDGYQVQAEVGMQYLHRISRTFSNPSMGDEEALEDLTGWRENAAVLVTKPFSPEWRWAASANIIHETCDVGTQFTETKNCHQEIIEPAADLQYEHKTIRLDASIGEAFPLFIGADPWFEAKLIARWRPSFGHLEVIGTAGRKGRVPALRERNDPSEGNPALGPEFADAIELRAIEHINERVHVEVAPFYRHVTGQIVIAPVAQGNPLYGKLINLGTVDFWGADTLGRVTILKQLEVGGGYSYIQARSYSDPNSDDDVISTHPLPRLPVNRWDAWVQVTPMPRLSLIARAIYFGSCYGGGNNGNGLLPGYTTFEATATWQINNRYLFVLRGEDLTNTRPEFNNNVYGLGTEIFAILQGTWD